MRQFLSFSRQFVKPLANSNTCIFVNIAWKMHCDILKFKLILCEWNAFYFIEIAFIGFTLHEIKQCIDFFWDTRYILTFYIIYQATRLYPPHLGNVKNSCSSVCN